MFRSRLPLVGVAALVLLFSTSPGRAAQSEDWRARAAAELPDAGEIHLGLFNGGERDGHMRLGWKRVDDRFEFYDRTMMPSAEVYETMAGRMSAADLSPLGTEIIFYQGTTVMRFDYELAEGQVTGARSLSGPDSEARSGDFDQPLPPGTLLRTASFLLPLALPREAGTQVSYPWFAPMSGAVEEVTLTAREGGRVETPAGEFDTVVYELRGGSPENDIFVSLGDRPRIVRIDVLGQPLRFLALE